MDMKTMIKLTIGLFIVLLYPMHLFSQTQVIELDFKHKKFVNGSDTINPYNLKLREGDLYQLKITGINMNLYEVMVEGKDSAKVNPPSIPLFDSFNLEPLNNLLDGLSPVMTTAQLYRPNEEDNNNRLEKNSGNPKLTVEQIRNNAIWEDIKTYISELKQIGTDIENYNKLIDELKISVFNKRMCYLIADKDSTNYKELNCTINFDYIISQSFDLRSKLKELIGEINDKQSNYDKFYEEAKPVIENNKELKEAHKKLLEIFSSAQSTCDNLYKTIDADKVNEWLCSIIHLENNSKNEYTSLPMQHNGDFSTLKICIKPKFAEYRLPMYETKIVFSGQPNNYSGVGTSFYVSNLYNEVYSVSATKIDSVNTDYRVVNEKSSKYEFGIASLFHYGWKFKNSNLGGHLSIGPAISLTNKIKPRICGGGGFSYGQKQRLTLDILGMAGYVDRKSNVYSENEVYSAVPEQITVSKLKIGYSIALGYIYKF
jgi:hypothetical protein